MTAMFGPDANWEELVEILFLAHMTGNWPAQQGLDFVRARSACQGTIAGLRTRSMDCV